MAAEVREDYLSQNLDTQYRKRITADTKPLTFTTTEAPKSSKPMSTARKISAGIITVAHIFSFIALYDMFFVLEPMKAFKWFSAAFIMYWITGTQGITAGVHRLWAHRSYKANLPTRIWLMIMNSIANQASIITWATEHRVHHIHSDTDADPHNINRGFFYAHMGWLYSPRTDAFVAAKKEVEVSDLYADPVANIQDKYYVFFGPFFCFILPTLMGLYFSNDSWRGFLYLGCLRWVLTLHVTWNINSVSHMFGSRPYTDETEVKATNNLFTSIFSGGEGWHHFHHYKHWSSDYRACDQESMWKWNDPSGIDWRFNAARFWIDLFAALGGVSDRKVFGSPLKALGLDKEQ